MPSVIDAALRTLIHKQGRITFAQFMQTCLYSSHGGFYAARDKGISAHFGTSAMTHPLFGALLARQLEQMWRLLGEPGIFHVIEVGCGDGALAQSIARACSRMTPRFARALYYVASDYAPRWLHTSAHAADWNPGSGDLTSAHAHDASVDIQPVKANGLHAFRNLVGCILSNELIDNFPVHRFVIQDGAIREVFVTLSGGKLTAVLGEPASACMQERLTALGLVPAEGFSGEVNLGLEDWTLQIRAALDRGFILTIDYGQLAADLYAPANKRGTLVCYHQHAATDAPYEHVGEQDITCHVDFTSLMQLGERHGLSTVGYTAQSRFLTNLGFASDLAALETQGLSSARAALNRMAMMALVDPAQYGGLKVLAQAKGVGPGVKLRGFADGKC